MATLQFSSISTRTKFVPDSKFISTFAGFNHKTENFNLFLIRTPRSSYSSRKFSAKNVASNQKQELRDPVGQEQEVSGALDTSISDSASIAASIKYHAEFTPSFSPERFELPKAFFATAEAVRDLLIIHWNATYAYYEKMNVKQAYYLSMEFLQGRALLNAIGNLELSGAYAQALRKLGHDLEDVARQVRLLNSSFSPPPPMNPPVC